MKKLLAISSVLFGIVFLSGCGQQSTVQTRPTAPAPTTEKPEQINTNNTTIASTDYKTYVDKQYKLSFQYPNTLTLTEESDSTKHILSFRATGPKEEYLYVYTNSDSKFYNPPAGTDVTNWIRNNRYENDNNDYFSNKIGAEFKIDNLPTLHIVNRDCNGGNYPNDEFYFIKNNKLYHISIGNEKEGLKCNEINNVDIANKNAWYVQFLQSFKFTE